LPAEMHRQALDGERLPMRLPAAFEAAASRAAVQFSVFDLACHSGFRPNMNQTSRLLGQFAIVCRRSKHMTYHAFLQAPSFAVVLRLSPFKAETRVRFP
jgi:hypothetical protein